MDRYQVKYADLNNDATLQRVSLTNYYIQDEIPLLGRSITKGELEAALAEGTQTFADLCYVPVTEPGRADRPFVYVTIRNGEVYVVEP